MTDVRIIKSVTEMKVESERLREKGHRIAFVPTMGYFHEGHLTLMRKARELGDVVVVSIYVNPIQFGPKEDFRDYPRDFERDVTMAAGVGVDIIFAPSDEEMYPEGFQTYVEVTEITRYLCGASRPGHFRGVTTVVAKLFNIVKPHIAVFGEKDYQQLKVIERMVRDLNMDVEIVGVPTVRESDGLAMSSRNVYLSEEERKSALSLVRSLEKARQLVEQGETDADKIVEAVKAFIKSYPHTEIDYVRLVDPETFQDVDSIQGQVMLALAVKVGKARLIDHAILNAGKG